MSRANRGQTLQATPEEVRWMRSFFRRSALPYLLAMGAIALGSLGWGLTRPAAPEAAVPAPAHDPAALEALRMADVRGSEADARLREDLDALGARLESMAREPAPVASLEPRFDAVSRRIDALESRLAQAPARMAEPPAEDAGPVLERLYNLEKRLEQVDQGARAVQKDVLERVYNLEVQRDAQSQERVSLDKTLLERLDNLEGRIYRIERTRVAREGDAGASPPAAPSQP